MPHRASVEKEAAPTDQGKVFGKVVELSLYDNGRHNKAYKPNSGPAKKGANIPDENVQYNHRPECANTLRNKNILALKQLAGAEQICHIQWLVHYTTCRDCAAHLSV